MLQRILLKFRKSVWIYPSIISFISLVGAVVVGMSDSGSFLNLPDFLPEFFLTSVELSKDILSVIAGSLITMTTFTFSTTMVVLTTYSSQFSPRTVENFLSDDDTMKALGVFMGGFVYSIVTLFFMKNSLGDKLVVSATLGIAYAIVCLVQFTMYIHHVGSYIQTNNLIDRLYQEAEKKISDYVSLLDEGTLIDGSSWGREDLVLRIKSRKEGYIQLIDHSSIYRTAGNIKGTVVLGKINGQFVTDESVLFSIYFDDEVQFDQETTDELLDSITIGKQKSEIQDFNFSMQKITEIALRAISPGINDPNTASHCLRIMGVLLGKIAHIDGSYMLYKGEEEYPKVAYEIIEFSQELKSSYHQILHYGKEDASVMQNMLKSIRFAADKASEGNRKAIGRYLEHVWGVLKNTYNTNYDLRILEREKEDIVRIIEE
ncbi:DUF2254 domain-containing protein [Gudongella sp. SC589]|jgi:uncharacterized membrane protein|uniref:DUF2254 domain-containing protein n=1 Tax=Gudongella sp. SC589 TaxID=3385990 RepID=UPI00390472E2